MGFIGGVVGYRLLRWLSDGSSSACDGSSYLTGSKLEHLFGPSIWGELKNKVVLDFGCGSGAEVVEIAQHGASRVVGLDIREKALTQAREATEHANVIERCSFVRETTEKFDVILSLDAFEHFTNPGEVLKVMRQLLRDDGRVLAVFGPTWYHPLGGHRFSVFPWSHLIFTEKALLRWRSDFKTDGATRFHEVEGGLNQMTIRRFEKLVRESGFRCERMDLVPIRRLSPFSKRWTREFTTAIVRCCLVL